VRLLIEALCAEHIYIYRLVLQERKNRGSTILYRYISIYMYTYVDKSMQEFCCLINYLTSFIWDSLISNSTLRHFVLCCFESVIKLCWVVPIWKLTLPH
jgi:hypothetical protein